jgi:hypothetical protein
MGKQSKHLNGKSTPNAAAAGPRKIQLSVEDRAAFDQLIGPTITQKARILQLAFEIRQREVEHNALIDAVNTANDAGGKLLVEVAKRYNVDLDTNMAGVDHPATTLNVMPKQEATSAPSAPSPAPTN